MWEIVTGVRCKGKERVRGNRGFFAIVGGGGGGKVRW